MKISEIKIGVRYRLEQGDIRSLVRSIEEVGLLHPIVVTPTGALIAGARRIEAFKLLGRAEIPVTVVDLKDLSRGELEENQIRKDFTPSEWVAIKRSVEPRLKEEAEKRMKAGKPSGKFPKGRARDKVASFVGVSDRTLEKAEKVVEAAEKDPEKFGSTLAAMDSGKTSVSFAYQRVKRETERATAPSLPEGKYAVIYADPPWEYEFGLRGSPDAHYPTMSQKELRDLAVPAAVDCVLFLWSPAPKLEAALEIMAEWNFIYKTCAVWVKDRVGTGYYFRGQHELLLLGVKGSPLLPDETDRPSSVFEAKRGAHSRKPDAAYSLIERMYPKEKKLEMFATAARSGWDAWGARQ